MTKNTTASGAADLLRAEITRAFNLGRTYWQQADSESYAGQGKPDITYKKYRALLDETCTPLAECAPVAPTQHIVLSDEQIKAHGDRASGMMARDMTRFDAACEVMKYLKERGAPYYYIYRMSIVLHGNYEGTEVARAPDKAAPVAPAPQPAVPKKKPLPDLMMAAYHEAIGWNACVDAMNVAAAPKADHIPEAGKKVGAPITEAEQAAWHAGLDEGRSQARVPLQQGEYPGLPQGDVNTGVGEMWNRHSMRAYVDDDRAAQPEGGA